MNNKERYKKAFSAVRPSEAWMREENAMEKRKHFVMPRLAAACLGAVLILGLSAGAYAANLGGIQRRVQLWVNGDLADAEIDFDGAGGYSAHWTDEEGETHEISGGGVVFDGRGNERPATAEELLAEMNAPNVEYREDGSVWVYYYDQKTEITELFDGDGLCHVELRRNGEPLYLTVDREGSFAYSSRHYPSAD